MSLDSIKRLFADGEVRKPATEAALAVEHPIPEILLLSALPAHPVTPAVKEVSDVDTEALASAPAPSLGEEQEAARLPFGAVPGMAGVPQLPRPLPPKPKPVIVPERTEKGFRTTGVLLERAGGGAHYITIYPEQRPSQRIYAPRPSVENLLTIAQSGVPEPGRLWSALCNIPLERPLPSRQLEEELKLLLNNFGPELRR